MVKERKAKTKVDNRFKSIMQMSKAEEITNMREIINMREIKEEITIEDSNKGRGN